ncbi:hypothetical protein Trisim1_010917 [Trichoderma cf. simile WF8]
MPSVLAYQDKARYHAGDAICNFFTSSSCFLKLQATAGSCKRCAATSTGFWPPIAYHPAIRFARQCCNPVSLRRVPERDIAPLDTLGQDAIGSSLSFSGLAVGSQVDASCPTVNVTTHRRVQPAFVDALLQAS